MGTIESVPQEGDESEYLSDSEVRASQDREVIDNSSGQQSTQSKVSSSSQLHERLKSLPPPNYLARLPRLSPTDAPLFFNLTATDRVVLNQLRLLLSIQSPSKPQVEEKSSTSKQPQLGRIAEQDDQGECEDVIEEDNEDEDEDVVIEEDDVGEEVEITPKRGKGNHVRASNQTSHAKPHGTVAEAGYLPEDEEVDDVVYVSNDNGQVSHKVIETALTLLRKGLQGKLTRSEAVRYGSHSRGMTIGQWETMKKKMLQSIPSNNSSENQSKMEEGHEDSGTFDFALNASLRALSERKGDDGSGREQLLPENLLYLYFGGAINKIDKTKANTNEKNTGQGKSSRNIPYIADALDGITTNAPTSTTNNNNNNIDNINNNNNPSNPIQSDSHLTTRSAYLEFTPPHPLPPPLTTLPPAQFSIRSYLPLRRLFLSLSRTAYTFLQPASQLHASSSIPSSSTSLIISDNRNTRILRDVLQEILLADQTLGLVRIIYIQRYKYI